MKEFVTKKPAIEFKVDDDIFEAIAVIPAEDLKNLAAQMSTLQSDNLDEQFNAVKIVMGAVLMPASYEIFVGRLSDKGNPIPIEAMAEIAGWLVGEVYGGRPTQSSPPSEEKPSDDGPSLTDGAPAAESTPGDLVGTDTSTSFTTG